MAEKITIGLDVDSRGVVSGLRKLTSDLYSAQEQWSEMAKIAPVIDTSKFSSSVKVMEEALQKISKFKDMKLEYEVQAKDAKGQPKFKKVGGQSVPVMETKNWEFKEDAFASVKNMRKTAGSLRSVLSSAKGDSVENFKEVITTLEQYTWYWGDAIKQVHNHNAAIDQAIRKEETLSKRQKERLANMRANLKDESKLKTVDDWKEHQRQLEAMSRYMRSWGTTSGRMLADKNDKEVERVKAEVNRRKAIATNDAEVLKLLEAQNGMLQKQDAIEGDSLTKIRERYNLAKRILEIQRQLNAKGVGEFGLSDEAIRRQEGIADPRFVKYDREVGVAGEAYESAKSLKNLYGMKSAKNTELALANRMYVETNKEEYRNAAEAIRGEIAAIQEEINIKQRAATKEAETRRKNAEIRREENRREREAERARVEANRQRKLSDAEIRIQNAEAARERAKQDSDSIQGLIAQRKATNELINALRMKRNAYRNSDQNVERQVIQRINQQIGQLEEENFMTSGAIADYRAGKGEMAMRDARIKKLKEESKELANQYNLLGRLKSQLSMYFSLYGLINIGKKIVEMTGYFEQQKVALEGIVGSAEKAGKVMNQIKDFALMSPFQTKDLVNFTKQLSAFSVPVDHLFDTTKRLADISAGLGVDMGRIVLAYGQVKSAAVLRGQELRQFTEAGIPMVDRLAKKLSEVRGELVSTGEVFEAISKRQVSFDMVDSVLKDLTSEGGQFYKMQENINKTLYGQVEKTKDMFTLAFNEIGKQSSGTLVNIVQKAQWAAKHIMMFLSTIQGFLVGKIATQVAAMGARLVLWVRRMRLEAGGILNGITRSVSSMINAAGIITTVISTAVGLIIGYLQKVNALQNKFNEIDEDINKNMSSAVQGLGRLVNKMQELHSASKQTSKEYKDLLDTLKANYGDYISDEMLEKYLQEAETVDKLAESYAGLQQAIESAIFARNQYLRLSGKEDAAAGEVAKWLQNLGSGFQGSKALFSLIQGSIIEELRGNPTAMNEKLLSLNDLGFSTKELGVSISNAAADAFQLLRTKDLATRDSEGRMVFNQDLAKTEYEKLITTAIKQAIPALGTGYDKQIKDIASFYWDEATKQSDFKTWADQYGALAGTTQERVKGYYKGINPEKEIEDYYKKRGEKVEEMSSIKYDEEVQKTWFRATKNAFDNELGSNEALKKVKGYAEFVNALTGGINDFEQDSGDNILNTLEALRRNLPQDLQYLNEIFNTMREELKSRINPVSGRAAIVRGRIFGREDWAKDSDLKAMFKEFGENVTTENYNTVRETLPKRYQEITSELESYNNGSDKKDDAIINKLKKQQEMLRELGNPEFYHIGVEKKGRGGRNDWQAFANSLFDRVKAAKEAQEKAYSTKGQNQSLIDFIMSLPDNDPLKGFYTGNNPFQDYFDRINEYDLEGIFKVEDFKIDDIKKYIKENGFFDYEALWKDLIEIVGKAAEKQGDEAKKSIIKAFDQRKMEEGDKLFGGDRIERETLETLRTLGEYKNTSDFKKSVSDKFEELLSANSTDFATLQDSLHVPLYRKRSEDLWTALAAGLQNDKLKGFKDTSVGQQLGALLGGSLGINKISELMDVIRQLDKISLTEDGKKQFEDIIPFFKDGINELIQALVDEFKITQETTMTDIQKSSSSFANLVYKNIYLPLHKLESLPDGNEKTLRKVDVLRRAYLAIIGDLGIQAQASWTNLYKDTTGKSGSGLTKTGEVLNNLFGNADLASRILAPKIKEALEKNNNGESFFDENGNFDLNKFIEEYKETNEKLIKEIKETQSKIKLAADVVNKLSKGLQLMDTLVNGIFDIVEATNGTHYDSGLGMYVQDMDKQSIAEMRETYKKTSGLIGGTLGSIGKFLDGDVLGGLNSILEGMFGWIEELILLPDKSKSKEQRENNLAIESLTRSIDELNYTLNDVVGTDKWDVMFNQIDLLQQQKILNESNRDLEDGKKGGDQEEVQKFDDAAKQNEKDINDIVRNIRQEIFGTADELANKLTDSLVDAFKNGENAARSWRNSVREYVGDVLKKVLMTNVIAPRIKKILDAYGINEDSSPEEIQSLFNNSEKAGKLVKDLDDEGNWLMQLFNALPERIQELIGWNSDMSSISGGIQSITEDTARTLEGLANSMLAQSILQTNHLEGIYTVADSQLATLDSQLQQLQEIRKYTKSIADVLNASYDAPTRGFRSAIQ